MSYFAASDRRSSSRGGVVSWYLVRWHIVHFFTPSMIWSRTDERAASFNSETYVNPASLASQSCVVRHLHDLSKSIRNCPVSFHATKILQNFWLAHSASKRTFFLIILKDYLIDTFYWHSRHIFFWRNAWSLFRLSVAPGLSLLVRIQKTAEKVFCVFELNEKN